jgi:Tfp pilus assembly protein PilX
MLIRIRRSAEDGIVMVTVLMITMILLIIVAGSLAYAVGSQPISRHDQDWNSALSAAEAGMDDFLFRLNNNDQYYNYSSSNLPPDGNTAFTTWTNVPNSNGGTQFRYSTDTSNLVSQGAIIITSTGRSRNAVRTIQATLRRHAFIDYLYFTDYETTDPALYPTGSNSNNSTWAQANCSRHAFDSPPRDSTCTDINFASGDTINGPMHTNDQIQICGSPTFAGNVTTSWNPASGNRWVSGGGGCSNAPTFKPGDPKYADPLTMPPNNISIKSDADKSLGGTGCLFTGPTSITLNSAGTMTVVSPLTKSTATTTNNCAAGTLASPVTEALPTNGVIYVQNMPTTTTDPNYSNTCTPGPQLSSGSTAGSGNGQNPLGYPERNDISSYSCTAGDVFLKGTLKGRLTIAADNNIELVGNVLYQSGLGGSDILGLVANNYIEIYHPVDLVTQSSGTPSTASWCDSGYLERPNNSNNFYCNADLPGVSSAFDNPVIDAAILSVNHSFRVQNYQYGDNNPLGTITINGAIAQRYRGIVGLIGTSGYTKTYNYDPRLKYQSPPRFLSPVAASWQIVTWIEQKPAYAYNAP